MTACTAASSPRRRATRRPARAPKLPDGRGQRAESCPRGRLRFSRGRVGLTGMAATTDLPAGATEYQVGTDYDEAFAGPGRPRSHYVDLLVALGGIDLDALEELVTEHV